MGLHTEVADRDVLKPATAMAEFVFEDMQYHCVADWPSEADAQSLSLHFNQGWPWLRQVSWFMELAKFEQNNHINAGHQYLILRVSQHQQLLALLPLRISDHFHTFHALSNYYSPEFAPLTSADTSGSQGQVWSLLLIAMSTLWPQWRQLSVQPVSPTTAVILEQHQIPRLAVLSTAVGHNWWAIANNQAEYWQKRSTQLLNTISRKRKKIKQQHADIQIYRELTAELLKAYWHIYQRSWKQPEPGTEFIDWLLNFADKQRQLRLGLLSIDNQPVAFQFWLVQQQQAAIVKLAQDQAFDHLSPGTVLMAAMIEDVMSVDGVTEIDFLTGNDQYKVQWMDQCQMLYRIDIFNRQHLSGSVHCLKLKLKRRLSHYKTMLMQYWLGSQKKTSQPGPVND